MGIFSTPSKTKYIKPEPFPGASKMRGTLAKTAEPGALERIGRAGEAYQGPLTAALSEYEQTSLQGLQDWLGKDLPTEGTLYKSAADEIQKTLSGEAYDPVNSDYYSAYRTQVLRELSEAKDRVAARASAGDKFYGGGRIATEGELEETTVGNLAVFLGQMQERERERRFGAVGPALSLAQYEETAPMGRIGAAQQYGELPRLIEQDEMDAEYQEWIRQLGDMNISIDVATGLATYQPNVIQEFQPAETKAWVNDTADIARIVAALG